MILFFLSFLACLETQGSVEETKSISVDCEYFEGHSGDYVGGWGSDLYGLPDGEVRIVAQALPGEPWVAVPEESLEWVDVDLVLFKASGPISRCETEIIL